MAYGSSFSGMDGFVPGFSPSEEASKALGDITGMKAGLQSDIAKQAFGTIGQVKSAELQADAMKAQAEAQQRAAAWSALGQIGGAVASAGIGAAFPTKIKVV
jgi:hypothetical protein